MPRPRKFSDEQLVDAVRKSRTWAEVMSNLGYSKRKNPSTVKSAAIKMGLDISKFTYVAGSTDSITGTHGIMPISNNKSRGIGEKGVPLAIAWFTENGYRVSIPVSGESPYDLVVESEGGLLSKVQVKTSTKTSHSPLSYVVSITRTKYVYDEVGKGKYVTVPYTNEEVDLFFIVTGDGKKYLIPLSTFGSKCTVVINNRYSSFELSG